MENKIKVKREKYFVVIQNSDSDAADMSQLVPAGMKNYTDTWYEVGSSVRMVENKNLEGWNERNPYSRLNSLKVFQTTKREYDKWKKERSKPFKHIDDYVPTILCVVESVVGGIGETKNVLITLKSEGVDKLKKANCIVSQDKSDPRNSLLYFIDKIRKRKDKYLLTIVPCLTTQLTNFNVDELLVYSKLSN